jgi:WD40 repeat protein
LTFSPDGKFLVSGGRDDIVRFWDAQTYTPIGLLAEGHRKPILRITFNPQGIAFATASGDNNLRLWGVPVQNQV